MEFIKHSKQFENGRRITVAANVRPSEYGLQMTFGIAVCKPGDIFVKRQARAKAQGRSISNNPALILTLDPVDRAPARIRDVYYRHADMLIAAKNEELALREQARKHAAKAIAQ